MDKFKLIFILTFVLILFIIAVIGYMDNVKMQKKMYKIIKKNYGLRHKKNDKKNNYSKELFLRHIVNTEDYFVDDITFSDLDGDSVFSMINHTKSNCGEAVLYDYFRFPSVSEESVHISEQDVSFFDNDEKSRYDSLYTISLLGKSKFGNTLDYLESNEKNYSFLIHIIGLSFFVFGIFALFFNALFGFVFLIFALAFNIVVYFREKAKTDNFLIPAFYIVKLIKCAELLSSNLKCCDKGLRISSIRDSLIEDCKKIRRITIGYKYVFASLSDTKSILSIITDYINMIFHIDLFLFMRIDSSLKNNRETIMNIYKNVGYVDAVLSVCSFRKSMETVCVPVFDNANNTPRKKDDELTTEISVGIKGIYHPMIEKPVKNDVDFCDGMLLTGSNASGKSTFLKAYAIAVIMAQSINTVCADSYRLPYLRVFSSMALKDNIEKGDSFFVAEIKSIKRIIDSASLNDAPIICFVDEILKGTNTVERIAASSQIAHYFSKNNIKMVFATHDIELTELLKDLLDNYHFEELIKDSDASFSYKLLSGKAKATNAIKLMRIMGFDSLITDNADAMVSSFEKSKEWKMLLGSN